MLDLVICELCKLKRKKIVLLMLGAACLFPIPVSMMVIANSYDMKNIFAMLVQLGDCFMMPLALGSLAMILFYTEHDNDTLKNMYLLNISMRRIVLAKFLLLLIASLVYSTVTILMSFLIGLAVGDVSGIGRHFLLNLLIGMLICIALLPVVAFVIGKKSNYVMTGICLFLFVLVNFVFVFTITPLPVWLTPFLPIAAVYRFFLPEVAVVVTVYVENMVVGGAQFAFSMLLAAGISCAMIERNIRKQME